MKITIATNHPPHNAIYLDLSGRTTLSGATALTLSDPGEILAAARCSRPGVDWVITGADSLPQSVRHTAAFLIALARNVPGVVFVVLDNDSVRSDRLAGHLRRVGAESG